MKCTTNTDRTAKSTALPTISRSDTTVAIYTALRLDAACVNLVSAIKRARDVGSSAARIAPKGRTLYSVKRGN